MSVSVFEEYLNRKNLISIALPRPESTIHLLFKANPKHWKYYKYVLMTIYRINHTNNIHNYRLKWSMPFHDRPDQPFMPVSESEKFFWDEFEQQFLDITDLPGLIAPVINDDELADAITYLLLVNSDTYISYLPLNVRKQLYELLISEPSPQKLTNLEDIVNSSLSAEIKKSLVQILHHFQDDVYSKRYGELFNIIKNDQDRKQQFKGELEAGII